MTGECMLCHQRSDLQKSHFQPAALYRLLRDKKDSSPMHNFGGDKFIQSDKQIKKYLLCKKCEELFSSKGEKEVVTTCYKGETFPIRDQLCKSPILFKEHDTIFFNPPDFKQKADCWLYFALSIFWRGSVARWGRFTGYFNALGDRYQENIRQYLLTSDVKYLENLCVYIAVPLICSVYEASEIERIKVRTIPEKVKHRHLV